MSSGMRKRGWSARRPGVSVRDMTGPEKLLDPTGADERSTDGTLTPRPAGLHGLVVGLLDNTKPNAEVLLSKIADELRGRYDVSGVRMYRKGYFGTPAEE